MVSDVCSRFRDEHLVPFTVGVPVIDKNLVGVFFTRRKSTKWSDHHILTGTVKFKAVQMKR